MISCCSCSKIFPVPWSPHSSCLQRDLLFYFMNGHCLFRCRTDLLAGAASDAEPRIQARSAGSPQSYRFDRADVCAFAAFRPVLKNDTGPRVETCFRNFGFLFGCQRQRADRPGRTDLGTAVAVELAGAFGQIQRNRAGAMRRRDNDFRRAIRRAELAGGAPGGKTFRISRSRRQNSEAGGKTGQLFHAGFCQHCPRGKSRNQNPAVDKKGAAGFIDGKRFPFRPPEFHRMETADGYAVHAADTAFVVQCAVFRVDAAGGTDFYAHAAFHALIGKTQPEHPVFRRQPEQGSDRTDRGAVDSFFPDCQRDDDYQRNHGADGEGTDDPPEIGVGIKQQKRRRPACNQHPEGKSTNEIAGFHEIRSCPSLPAGKESDEILQNSEGTEDRAVKASEQESHQCCRQQSDQCPCGECGKAFHQNRPELPMQKGRENAAFPGKTDKSHRNAKCRRRNSDIVPFHLFFHCSNLLEHSVFPLSDF